jgi:hypothetical protein
MTDFSWSLSHRQLLSAIISLVVPSDGGTSPFLRDLGYELRSLELPITDRQGRPYRLDLHLTHGGLNLSLLVECKTTPAVLEADQIEKYMGTTGAEIVIAASLTLPTPREHKANAAFIVLPGVEQGLANLVASCPVVLIEGWGLIRVAPSRMELVHDEISDADLSRSLTAGWDVEVERLPLERLPYESDSPRWDLADSLLRTLTSMFVTGRREFGVDDLCTGSNELWEYLEPQHDHIRRRVRDEIRTLRRTALKGWIAKVEAGTGREERWRFTRKATSNRNVVAGFNRRHKKYVSVLLDERRDPTPNDFVNIDPEQLTLPIPVAEG